MIKQGYCLSIIQNLCDTLVEHPTWNMAHLVVRLSMIEILSNPSVVMYVYYLTHFIFIEYIIIIIFYF